MSNTNSALMKTLCKKFVERTEALGLRGKKRDDALVDFMCGAATALPGSSAAL